MFQDDLSRVGISPVAKENMAVALLEMRDVDEAKQLFLTLVPPHPDAPSPPSSCAYYYLARLTGGDARAALSHYQSAIDLLKTQLKGKSTSTENTSEEDDTRIKGNIILSYLRMVKVWMDPKHNLCADPAASSTCVSLLSRALEIDPQNLEALQMLASVRHSPGLRT